MLYFSRWKTIAIPLTVSAAYLVAGLNLLPSHLVARRPRLAQRRIVLGLDLQGASHLLLEVDSNTVRKEAIQSLRDEAIRVLRRERVAYSAVNAGAGHRVSDGDV